MTLAEDQAKAISERCGRLANSTARAYVSFAKRALVAVAVSSGVALAAVTAIQNLLTAEMVAISATAFVTILVLGPAWNADWRGAAALFYDHFDTERARWKRETRTSLPRGKPALVRWIDAHPGSEHAISILLALGRLDEADALIAAADPSTPLKAFDIELSRQTSAMLAGRGPNVSNLQRLLPEIPSPADRRLKTECLALFESELAFDRGDDPLPILGLGWRAATALPGRSRASWALMLFPIVGLPIMLALLVRVASGNF